MVEQAARFAGLAPNMQVKLPVTIAGLAAIEEATAAGHPVNATVNFTVAGAIAVAEAVERGLSRRAASRPRTRHPASRLHPDGRPAGGLAAGRLRPRRHPHDAGRTEWAGIAVFKRAYAIYRESRAIPDAAPRGAFRNHLPWSQLIGGDIVLTIPPAWQHQLNPPRIEVRSRIDEPVEASILSRAAWRPCPTSGAPTSRTA